MTSVIKVDQIQKADGSTPSSLDLGIESGGYWMARFNTASYSTGSEVQYSLSDFISEGTDGGRGATIASNQIVITEAGKYHLHLFLACYSSGNTNSRWQENYINVNGTRIADSRQFVINIDTNFEYYHIAHSQIYTFNVGDVITVSGNGQSTWGVVGSDDQRSNIHAVKLS